MLEIDGKSLIGHAITVALDSNLNVDVVLSSESDEILSEGLKYGARLHKRPEYLSSDTATTISVVEDVLNATKYIPDLVIVLQPTSPLRTKENVIEAVLLVKNSDFLQEIVGGGGGWGGRKIYTYIHVKIMMMYSTVGILSKVASM